jgi:hypothetical protein
MFIGMQNKSLVLLGRAGSIIVLLVYTEWRTDYVFAWEYNFFYPSSHPKNSEEETYLELEHVLDPVFYCSNCCIGAWLVLRFWDARESVPING